jgi:hypothetical protein
MATIKKACKGVSYPKASSVSSRLKKGGSVKKAQTGIQKRKIGAGTPATPISFAGKKKREAISQRAKSAFEASKNPKVGYDIPARSVPGYSTKGASVDVDTTGLAAGAKRFPVRVKSNKTGKEQYGETTRAGAKRTVKISKQKAGGTTPKAQFGYQGPHKFSLNPLGSKEKREWRKENREGRKSMRSCRSGRCGGRGAGFIGYKTGGKVKKK